VENCSRHNSQKPKTFDADPLHQIRKNLAFLKTFGSRAAGFSSGTAQARFARRCIPELQLRNNRSCGCELKNLSFNLTFVFLFSFRVVFLCLEQTTYVPISVLLTAVLFHLK